MVKPNQNQGTSQNKPKKKNGKRTMGIYSKYSSSCRNCGAEYLGAVCPVCKTERGKLV